MRFLGSRNSQSVFKLIFLLSPFVFPLKAGEVPLTLLVAMFLSSILKEAWSAVNPVSHSPGTACSWSIQFRKYER